MRRARERVIDEWRVEMAREIDDLCPHAQSLKAVGMRTQVPAAHRAGRRDAHSVRLIDIGPQIEGREIYGGQRGIESRAQFNPFAAAMSV